MHAMSLRGSEAERCIRGMLRADPMFRVALTSEAPT